MVTLSRWEYFSKNIIPWIFYNFISLSLFLPPLVIGILSANDECLKGLKGNSTIVSVPVWLFVYGATIVLLNVTFFPMIYLFVKLDIKTGMTKRYITSCVVSIFIVGFLMAWSGVGIHLYTQTSKCSYIHASNMVLASSIIWLSLIAIGVLATIIAAGVLLSTM